MQMFCLVPIVIVVKMLYIHVADFTCLCIDLVLVFCRICVKLDLINADAIFIIQFGFGEGSGRSGDSGIFQGDGFCFGLADIGRGRSVFPRNFVILNVLIVRDDFAVGSKNLIIVLGVAAVEFDFINTSAVLVVQFCFDESRLGSRNACVLECDGFRFGLGDALG